MVAGKSVLELTSLTPILQEQILTRTLTKMVPFLATSSTIQKIVKNREFNQIQIFLEEVLYKTRLFNYDQKHFKG